MTKPSKTIISKPYKAYSLVQKSGGYAVVQLILENDSVVSAQQIHEPDMLPIALAVLQRALRKDIELG